MLLVIQSFNTRHEGDFVTQGKYNSPNRQDGFQHGTSSAVHTNTLAFNEHLIT